MVAPRAQRLELKCLLIPATSSPITTHTNHPEFQPQTWASQTHTSEPFAHKCSCLQMVIKSRHSGSCFIHLISSHFSFGELGSSHTDLLSPLWTCHTDSGLLEDILAWSLGLSFMHSASVIQPATATSQLCLQLVPSCLFLILREIANFKAFPEQTV